MSKPQDYLNTHQGAPPPEFEFKTAAVVLPSIGDIVNTPNATFIEGEVKFSQLLTDGSTFDELLYPELYAFLQSNVLPTVANIAPEVPARIVGDYYAG